VVEILAKQGRRQRCVGSVGHADADHQRTGGAGQYLQEAAPIQPDRMARLVLTRVFTAHGWPALPAATRLIAWRTRIWQPQRHRFGNWSMSSSPGLGLRR